MSAVARTAGRKRLAAPATVAKGWSAWTAPDRVDTCQQPATRSHRLGARLRALGADVGGSPKPPQCTLERARRQASLPQIPRPCWRTTPLLRTLGAAGRNDSGV